MTTLKGAGYDVSGVRVKHVVENHRRPLTDDEVKKLLAAADGELLPVVALGLFAGLRLGDACRVEASQVRNGVLYVTQGKTGRQIAVPICEELAKRLPTSEPWMPTLKALYAKSGNDLVDDRMRKLWARAGIVWGKGGTTFHSLRHTYATRLAESGAPQAVIMSLCGHRSVAMSLAYQHLSAQAARVSIDRAFNQQ